MEVSILSLWRQVLDHPDYAGGVLFTRINVAQALAFINDDDEGMEDPTDEAIAAVTEDQMKQTRNIVDNLLNRDYTFFDACLDCGLR